MAAVEYKLISAGSILYSPWQP